MYVTGAGFTRAFVPDAPLLIDDFGNDRLVHAVRGLPMASRILEAERNRHRDGHIDIERLMTRLHELMPYDQDRSSTDEFAFLLSELKRSFLRRIQDAMDGVDMVEEVVAFGRHCADINATCVTFNYDDLLDAALFTTKHWNPHWGYGFFCRPSTSTVCDLTRGPRGSDLALLKLHGSVNWWPRLGYSWPFALDAIVHHQSWGLSGPYSSWFPHDLVSRHLEPEPVIVPPVLSKSDLVAQPALRLVWSLAYEHLSTADSVTFIGYSFPATDTAARVLFEEALADLPSKAVTVVSLETDPNRILALKARYRAVLGPIPDSCFFFEGACSWVRHATGT